MVAVWLTPVYILAIFYVIVRTMYWLRACTYIVDKQLFQAIALPVIILIGLSPVVGMLLPNGLPKRVFVHIGNYWIGTLLYILLFTAVADLLRFICKWIRFFEHRAFHTNLFRGIMGGIVCLLVVAMSVYGIINAHIVRKTEYEVSVNKTCAAGDELKVALVADLHMGYNISTSTIREMVERVNELEPDVVCIAGDIFDNSYDALYHPQQLAEILRGIHSTYGVYACWGNHDVAESTLVGFTFNAKDVKKADPRMVQLLKDANITLLEDESVLVEDAFYLVGRRDAKRPGNDEQTRLAPDEILAGLDQTKPIIVIDHQPAQLHELAAAGADIDLGGHTHDGQLFPGNLTIGLAWENACGYLQVENMHSIVTSGVGVYGPNMRTFTKSEVVGITVHFNSNNAA